MAEVAAVLARLRASGLSIILVEQNIKLALEIADDVVVLNGGRLAHAGSVATIRSNPQLLDRLLGVY